MENISRKQLDRICLLLSNHINTEESIKLSKILHDADVIPKLYVYTYFKKIHKEIQTLKIYSHKFDFEEFNNLTDSFPALGLDAIAHGEELHAIYRILDHGFSRYGMFCDFDDSRFHDMTKSGNCECENHGNEYWEYEINNAKNKDEKLVLHPVYDSNEDTEKLVDSPEWWCKICCDNDDNYNQDECGEVRCDMEMTL